MGCGTFINTGLRCGVPDGVKVIIGNDCAIGPNVSFETVNHHLRWHEDGGWGSSAGSIQIGDRVWIGARVIFLAGVHVGDDCVIAAGSVVTKSLPALGLYGGVPAKLIRKLSETPSN